MTLKLKTAIPKVHLVLSNFELKSDYGNRKKLMHRLCRQASRILLSRPKARYHICPPCATQILSKAFSISVIQRNNDTAIRFYEQSAPGVIREIHEGAEEAEDEQSDDFKARFAQVEKDFKNIESSGDLPSEAVDDVKEFRRQLAALRNVLAENGSLDQAERTEETQDIRPQLTVGFPKRQRIHLQSFNIVLQEVARNVQDADKNSILWAKYVRCKRWVPDFLEEVSTKAWDVLWESQYTGNPEIASRTKHLWELVDDMVRVRRELTPIQKLVRVESLYARGEINNAFAFWHSEWSRLKIDDPMRSDFRDLGIRLNADIGRLEEARELALDTAQSKGKPKAEDTAILIASWARKRDEDSLRIAWSLYLDLRQRLGHCMSLNNYDDIIMAFLGTGSNSLALAVFKDMVLSGKRPDWDSLALAKTSMELYRELQNHSNQLADLTQVSLAALSFIPRQLENKYFFASWIKRLIGMGEVDSAVLVLELMYERGIRPDAVHLNGMLNAWLRSEDQKKHSLALQVGWSMVKERLKFVAWRDTLNLGRQSQVDLPDLGVLVPSHISKNLPSATIETFSILLFYYESRSMQTSMDIVQQMLQRAELRPNSFFMNHLLHSELRKNHIGEMWKKFSAMQKSINPDLKTFSVLWEGVKASNTGRYVPGKEGFPTPRTLLARMVGWLISQRPRLKKAAKEEFTQAQYNLIIQCFCFRQDIEGTIIALYALRDAFGIYPDADTARIVSIQLARRGENTPAPKRKRSRLSSNKDSIRRMSQVSEIFTLVGQERADALKKMGVSEEVLPPEAKDEEMLYKLAEVLRLVLRHATDEGDTISPGVEELLEKVAWEMSVGGICMEAPAYSHGEESISTSIEAMK